LNQEDINHLNRYITQKEIEAAIVSQKSKVQDLKDTKKLYPIAPKHHKKLQQGGRIQDQVTKIICFSTQQ
jgi:hypothetical protein